MRLVIRGTPSYAAAMFIFFSRIIISSIVQHINISNASFKPDINLRCLTKQSLFIFQCFQTLSLCTFIMSNNCVHYSWKYIIPFAFLSMYLHTFWIALNNGIGRKACCKLQEDYYYYYLWNYSVTVVPM